MLIIFAMFVLVAAGLAYYLIAHDRGAKEPPAALWGAFVLGVAILVPVGWLENFLIPDSVLTGTVGIVPTFIAYMMVGVVEECVKFLPLAWFIYKKPHFNEHTDGVIYFALVGLGFGLAENLMYAYKLGAAAGIIRIILVPFFHAATTGIVGYYLAESKLGGRSWSRPLTVLAGIALIHGLYDFGLVIPIPYLNILSLMITLLLTLGLFLYYWHAGERDIALGLAQPKRPRSQPALPGGYPTATGYETRGYAASLAAGYAAPGAGYPAAAAGYSAVAAGYSATAASDPATGPGGYPAASYPASAYAGGAGPAPGYATQPAGPATAGGGKAVAALVLGSLGLLGWVVPALGITIGIGAFSLGILSSNSIHRKLAVAGIALSVPTILLSVFALIYNLQHP